MAETTNNVGYQAMEVLYNTEGKTTPTEIGAEIGIEGFQVGRQLKDKVQQQLVNKTLEGRTSYYQITDKGRQWVEAERERIASIGSEREKPPTVAPAAGAPAAKAPAGAPAAKVEADTIPSQSDIFRREGELLGVGVKKGEIHLDTIVKWVQRTADLDDLNSVWNALTEMNVANDVKKRWIKLYAQNLPGKQIPAELKEKLESGQEAEKVSAEGKGEIQPKPKRFSLVGDDIVGDPEGDLTFNEALKLLAQKKGVPAEQASPLAAMVEAMKLGPEMATATLTTMIPLLTKQGDTSGTNVFLQLLQTQNQNAQQQVQALQQLIMALTEDKHKAEMESLKALIMTGQRAPEADQRLDTLTKQIETLRESLHQEQLTRMTEQSQRTAELLQGEIKRLEEKIVLVAQSQHTESSLGLLSKAVDKLDGQLSGIRTDARPLVETIMKGGGPPLTPRSPEDRTRLAQIGKEAVLRERRAQELENELLSS